MTKQITIILAFLVMLSSTVAAQDFEKSLAAADTGDYATALQEWTPLAEAGNASAQYNLGIMYQMGRGVPQDYKEAFRLFKSSAEGGYARAQYKLTIWYTNGGFEKYDLDGNWALSSSEENYKEAFKWVKLAAVQGYTPAIVALAAKYLEGTGVTQNYKEALKWNMLAAEFGDGGAQGNLSHMYLNGYGVRQDNFLAHMWANIAATNGAANGIGIRNLAAKSMTTKEITKAQAMAAECVGGDYKNCGY